MPKKLLVYSRDTTIGQRLRDGLRKRDVVISATRSKMKMLLLASPARADILLVDGSDSRDAALAFCRQLRKRNANARIILVTPDQRKLTRAFVDAAFCAPITLRKLLHRLRRLLEPNSHRLIRIGSITLDVDNRRLGGQDQESLLTPIETLLMQRAGSTVTRRDIMHQVWRTDYTGVTRILDVYIHRLRHLVEPDPKHPQRILTVRGKGYRFAAPPSALEPREATISGPVGLANAGGVSGDPRRAFVSTPPSLHKTWGSATPAEPASQPARPMRQTG